MSLPVFYHHLCAIYYSGARLIRNNILNVFTTAYKLKTLPEGALVREWPAGFSVWFEDETQAEGYRLLRSFESDPPREAVNSLLDVSYLIVVGVVFNSIEDTRLTHNYVCNHIIIFI